MDFPGDATVRRRSTNGSVKRESSLTRRNPAARDFWMRSDKKSDLGFWFRTILPVSPRVSLTRDLVAPALLPGHGDKAQAGVPGPRKAAMGKKAAEAIKFLTK